MKKMITMLLVLLATSSSLWAQVSAYSFTEGTETYAAITGTTSTAAGDDGTELNIPITFTFTFGGVAYTHFSLTTNGMIKLGTGASTLSSGWTNSLSNTATHRPLIAPFWDDNNLTGGSIVYAVTGTSPNQVLTINYQNTKVGGGGSTAGVAVSHLTRLYESTNVIEMVYDTPFTTTNSVSASVGLNDMTSFLSVTPAAASTASGATANNAINATVMANLAGKSFSFAPPAPPACPIPSAVVSTPSGPSTTDVSWSCPSCTGNFIIETGLAGFTPGIDATAGAGGTIESTTAVSPFALLLPTATDAYDIYVRQDCGGSGFSDNAAVVRFLPGDACGNAMDLSALTSPFSGTTVGYTNDIAACRAGSPDRIFFIDILANETLTIGEAANSYDEYEYVGFGDVCPGATQIACIDNDALAQTVWLNSTGMTQRVWYVQDGFGTTPPGSSGTFTLQWTITPAPSCPSTSVPTASNILGTSADISWNELGSAVAWDLYYGTSPLTAPTDATPPSVQDVTSNVNYPLTGLNVATSYSLYVRADCAPGTGTDSSLWVGPLNFTTPCPPTFVAPYSENFDAIAATPPCWSQATTSGGPWVFGTTSPGFPFCSTGLVDHTTGSGNLAAVDMSGTDTGVILTSPVIDVTGLTIPALSFWVNICNADDATTFNTISVEAFDGVSAWTQVMLVDFHTVGWEEQIMDVSGFTFGADLVQIRFVANDNSPLGQAFVSDLHIDDFSIAEAPTCTPTVTNVNISNINDDGAVIDWDINIWNAAETYEVLYGPALEFTSGLLGAGVTTFTMSGLTADMFNQVQVNATCGASGNSFFTTLTCDTTAQCSYTLTLNDVNGDGWNWGEFIQITNGNQAPLTYTIPAGTCAAPCATVFTFDACPADDILVEYVGGANGQAGDNENYWNLSGPNGFNFTQAPAMTSSNTFGACPTCPTPFSAVAENVCEDAVDLSWNNGAVYDTVIVETSFLDPFTLTFAIVRDTIVGSPSSYSLTGGTWGLDASVDFQIIGICTNGDQGATSGSFVSPSCNCADQCSYDVILTDSWGDGWDAGSYVEVYQNFVLTHTLELVDGDPSDQCLGGPGGCSQVFTVSVCPDAALDFVYTYTSGSFAGEQSFEVVAPYSSPAAIFSSGTGPVTGTSFSEIACPACPAPIGLSCSVVDYQAVDVDFTSWNAGATYTVYYNTVDDFFSATAGVTGTSVAGANTGSQAGLAPSTTFFFWVAEDCAGSPSLELGSSSCSTPAACPAPSTPTCSVFSGDDILVEFTTGGIGSTYNVIMNTVQDSLTATVVGSGTSTAGTNQLLVGGLTAATDYYFWVYEDCGALGLSDTSMVTSCNISGTFCDWTVQGWDSWGDGWNGGTIDISVAGTVVHNNVTVSGQTTSWTISVTDGQTIEIAYNGGSSFPTEMAFQLRDALGNVVATEPAGGGYGLGPSVDTGIGLAGPYSYAASACPAPDACPAPTMTASNVTATTVDLDWISGNGGSTWTIAYGPAGFTIGGAGEEDRATGTTVGIETETLSGLSSSTAYQACIFEDCGVDGSSDTTCVSFTTGLINDLCEGALPIDCDSLISGSTVTATPTVGLLGTTGGSEAAKDVWYTFVGYNQDDLAALIGTPGNEVQVSTCPLTSPGSATYDTKIDIYTGACGSLTWLIGNDDSPGCSLRSSVSFPTEVGTTYYVRVYGFTGTSQGNFELSMLCEAPCLPVPANSSCATPETVALQAFGTAPNILGTNECSPAGVYPGCGSTFSTYSGSWYEFNSGPTGEVYIEVALGTIAPGNLGFALYNTAPCDGTTDAEICVTGFGGIAPSQILLTPNTDYKMSVFTVQGSEGTYSLVVTGPPPAPVNDDCEGAIDVPVTAGLTCTGGTAATFYGATETTSPDTDIECGVQGAQKDVWMKFTVPASGRVQMNYTPVSIGTGVPRWSLYRSATDCSGMTFVSGSCTTTDPRVLPAYGASSALALTPGETMYVRLWAPTNSFTGNFTFCVTDPVPANSECSNATSVAVSEFGTPAWTVGNSRGAFGGNACAGGTANEQVWYSFVATDPTHVVLVKPSGSGNYNAVIELFDGCGGTSLGCRNNYGASALERGLYTGLTPGNTYYYSVHHLGGSGTASSDVHETFVQGFHAGMLQSQYCGVNTYNLAQSIYSERDDIGQLYSSPLPSVTGYGFRFQEIPSGIDVVVQNPVSDGFYMQLQNVPGLEYGKQYNVSVQHRVMIGGNGTVDQYWSGFGPSCVIGLSPLPTTNIRPQFCTGATDFYLGDQLLAVQLSGATQYRFNFTPTGGGATISELSSNYAVSLYNVGPLGGPGLQYGVSYDVTVEALVTTWTPIGSTCTINMATQPEDTGVRPSYCNGTYLFPNSNFILAESVLGASMYEFRFTPSLGGSALTQINSTISFAFHLTSLPFVSGTTYDVEVRAHAGGVWGDYSSMCPITIQAAPEMQGGDGEEIAVKKLDASAIATLYPNPNLGENLYISLTDLDDKPQHIVIEVLDITGKIVFVQDVANNGKTANVLINFNEKLSKGMYFVNIYMDQSMLTEKLTVE